MHETLRAARKIVNYLETTQNFKFLSPPIRRYEHMGALTADAVLQAGLNYKTVVAPRVQRIETEFSQYKTTSDFLKLCYDVDIKFILKWKDERKPKILIELLALLVTSKVETVVDLKDWMGSEESEVLRSISGVGSKTMDYLSLLSGRSAIPIDRHFKKLFTNLNLEDCSYDGCKKTLEICADLMDVERNAFDYSLWNYLSKNAVFS